MLTEPVRVGVIGADPTGRGFGPRAHLPAIIDSPDLDLLAVATSREETARSAAKQWSSPRWYAGYEDLLADPDIEAVTIAVRVRLHYEIVSAALDAGKAVYCEWPLSLNSQEAATLVRKAEPLTLTHGVGTQGRYAPAMQKARELVEGEEIGRPLSFHVTQLLPPFEVQSDRWWFAKDEEASGALHVATAHVMDSLQFLLGPIVSVTGLAETKLPDGKFTDTGQSFEWTADDTVAWTSRLTDGVVGTGLVANTSVPSTGFELRVLGTDGQLLIKSDGYQQFRPLQLTIGHGGKSPEWTEVDLAVGRAGRNGLNPAEPGFNVSRALTAFAKALRAKTEFHPDFRDAERLHRVIEAVVESSRLGHWIEVK